MAVDLRNGLGTAMGRNLPATLLFDYPTVFALAGYLSTNVLGLDEAPSEPPRQPSAVSDTSGWLSRWRPHGVRHRLPALGDSSNSERCLTSALNASP